MTSVVVISDTDPANFSNRYTIGNDLADTQVALKSIIWPEKNLFNVYPPYNEISMEKKKDIEPFDYQFSADETFVEKHGKHKNIFMRVMEPIVGPISPRSLAAKLKNTSIKMFISQRGELSRVELKLMPGNRDKDKLYILRFNPESTFFKLFNVSTVKMDKILNAIVNSNDPGSTFTSPFDFEPEVLKAALDKEETIAEIWGVEFSKPEATNWIIEPGLYEGSKALAAAISRNNILICKYDKVFTLEPKEGVYGGFTLSPYLSKMLGLEYLETYEGKISGRAVPSDLVNEALPLYIHTNLIQEMSVGGQSSNVIGVIAPKEKAIMLRGSVIQKGLTIFEFHIRDRYDNPVFFQRGNTTLHLMFSSI